MSHSKRPGSKAGITTTGAGGGVRKPLPSSSGSPAELAAAKKEAEHYADKLRKAILSGEKLDKAVKVLEQWVGQGTSAQTASAKKKAA